MQTARGAGGHATRRGDARCVRGTSRRVSNAVTSPTGDRGRGQRPPVPPARLERAQVPLYAAPTGGPAPRLRVHPRINTLTASTVSAVGAGKIPFDGLP